MWFQNRVSMAWILLYRRFKRHINSFEKFALQNFFCYNTRPI